MPHESPRGPAYRILTKRLVIRCWQPADAPLLKEAIDASLDHLLPWIPWAVHEPEDVETKIERLRQYRGAFDLGQDFVYGIFDRDETRVLGGTGLHTRVGAGAREIGYWIHVDAVNQGLATESTAALTKVAFVIDRVRRVELRIAPANVRSQAVARKLGYVYEATLRSQARGPEERPRDLQIWTMLTDEFQTSVAAAAELEAFDVIGRRLL